MSEATSAGSSSLECPCLPAMLSQPKAKWKPFASVGTLAACHKPETSHVGGVRRLGAGIGSPGLAEVGPVTTLILSCFPTPQSVLTVQHQLRIQPRSEPRSPWQRRRRRREGRWGFAQLCLRVLTSVNSSAAVAAIHRGKGQPAPEPQRRLEDHRRLPPTDVGMERGRRRTSERLLNRVEDSQTCVDGLAFAKENCHSTITKWDECA